MTEILQIIQDFDWSPFWISLKTGIVATIICFFLGIWLARQIIRLGPKSKAILDGILTLPMVVRAYGSRLFPAASVLPSAPLRLLAVHYF